MEAKRTPVQSGKDPLMRRALLLMVAMGLGCAGIASAQRSGAACDRDNGGLVLPAGFCATLFATVGSPRHIAVAPNGEVFVSGTRGGVPALRDRKGDGHADTTATFGANYGIGTGLAITGDAIY